MPNTKLSSSGTCQGVRLLGVQRATTAVLRVLGSRKGLADHKTQQQAHVPPALEGVVQNIEV